MLSFAIRGRDAAPSELSQSGCKLQLITAAEYSLSSDKNGLGYVRLSGTRIWASVSALLSTIREKAVKSPASMLLALTVIDRVP